MSEVLFSDTTTCDRCGAIDFVNGLSLTGNEWLCQNCAKGVSQSDDE